MGIIGWNKLELPTVYAEDLKEMEGDMGKVVTVWERVHLVKPPVYWEVSDTDVNTT